MNDETKAGLMKQTREWLQSCVNAATRSGVPEEADLEAFILAHIDGEPARLAAAREAAVMEWRAGAADRDELRADCERQIAAAREKHANAWMRKCQAAEAQVAAARAECERLIDRPWSRWAGDAGRDVLGAMDEAAKK